MSGARHGQRKPSREAIKANVLTDTIEGIRQEAQARGVPFMTLVATLLDTINREKKFDSVLGGQSPRVREGA